MNNVFFSEEAFNAQLSHRVDHCRSVAHAFSSRLRAFDDSYAQKRGMSANDTQQNNTIGEVGAEVHYKMQPLGVAADVVEAEPFEKKDLRRGIKVGGSHLSQRLLRNQRFCRTKR